jgi:hypothetical protein
VALAKSHSALRLVRASEFKDWTAEILPAALSACGEGRADLPPGQLTRPPVESRAQTFNPMVGRKGKMVKDVREKAGRDRHHHRGRPLAASGAEETRGAGQSRLKAIVPGSAARASPPSYASPRGVHCPGTGDDGR